MKEKENLGDKGRRNEWMRKKKRKIFWSLGGIVENMYTSKTKGQKKVGRHVLVQINLYSKKFA